MHYEGSLLSPAMKEKTIVQVTLSSIECFDGIKSKFKAWTESIENAAQISGQHTLNITFSKMMFSLVT